jgi:outer membrane protein assembly factor BamB
LVWKQPIGAGWSAFVAVNGYGITQEQRGEEELVTCYDIATGKLIWANAVSQRHETVMGGAGPRATPAVDEGHVYAMGAGGLFRCLKGTDGSERWRRDLLAETGVTSDEAGIAWGRAGSPLVLGSLVIVPLGGPNGGPYVSLLACDKLTGEIVWKAGDMQISYASPTLVQLQQVEQILIVLEDHVAAFDPVQGSLLWKHPWPGGSTSAANVSNAVAVDEGRVFVSKGYAQGAMLLNVSRDESGTWSTDVVWENPVVMKSKFSNVVYQDGYLYGLDDVVLSCIDVETGRRAWKKGRYGYGQILLVGDTLLVGEEGQLAAVAADPDQYRPLAEIAAIEGKTWNNLCLYGNYILVRNSQEAACYELPLLTSPNDESATATETKRDHSGNASGNSSPGSSGNST